MNRVLLIKRNNIRFQNKVSNAARVLDSIIVEVTLISTLQGTFFIFREPCKGHMSSHMADFVVLLEKPEIHIRSSKFFDSLLLLVGLK